MENRNNLEFLPLVTGRSGQHSRRPLASGLPFFPLSRTGSLYALLVLTLCISSFAGQISAQSQFNYVKLINSADGLPTDRANCVTQDDRGFLWIGTNSGVVRYDGSLCKIYQYTPEDTNSIADNRIRDLLVDGNNLWIGTHHGLSRMNMTTGTIRNYAYNERCEPAAAGPEGPESVHRLYKDGNGTLWIATQHCGFARYVPSVDSFEFFMPDTVAVMAPYRSPQTYARLKRAKNILSFTDDVFDKEILWVGTSNGLFRFNKGDHSYKLFVHEHPEYQRKRQINGYRDIVQDKDGIIYSGAWSSHFNLFDTRAEEFTNFSFDDDARAHHLINGVHRVVQPNDSTVWITTGGGFGEFNTRTRTLNFILENDTDNDIYYGCHFIDRDKRIYCPEINGLTVFDPIQQQFEPVSFKSMNPGKWGLVFSVTHDTLRNRYTVCPRVSRGLYHLEIPTRRWTMTDMARYQEDDYDHASPTNLSMMKDGRYLLATYDKLLIYDPDRETFSQLPVNIQLKTKVFQDVFVDSRNVAWINTRGDGVFQWDINSNKVKQHVFPGEILSTAASDTETFYEDSRGRIWMKRRYAYSVYYPETDSIVHVEDRGLHATYNGAWAEDEFGNMWIASVRGWIGAIDMDNVGQGVQRKVTVGEYNNDVTAIAKDRDGRLWIALKNHLARFDPANNEVHSFSYAYGADPSDIFSFQIMHDGMMVFGNRNQIVIADPNTLRRNDLLPRPYLTEFNVPAESYQNDTLACKLSNVSLAPDENFFSIGFSTVALSFGDENQIQFRLSGFQDEWQEAGASRQINYTNVPAGDYTFELKAANNEGIENPELFQLPIHVSKVWYHTWFARSIGILMLLALIYAGYHYNVTQIRKQERMRTEFQRRLADVEMSALRAQMNPHFIFNCLNSIENYVIKNETLKASTYLNDFARLIRLILQNSRSKYIPLKDEMEALELYLQMESLRFINKFNYTIEVGDEVDLANTEIPPMLVQPYVENAIWHGLMPKSETGNLKISLSRQNGMLNCIIEDDGIGRARSQQIRRDNAAPKKKSMGMSITKERINILNKFYNLDTHIEISDILNEQGDVNGTKVELNIPL